MKIARANQKPGQTKEQTQLIAQGIQKGIDEYKKQMKVRAREASRQKNCRPRPNSPTQRRRMRNRTTSSSWSRFLANIRCPGCCWPSAGWALPPGSGCAEAQADKPLPGICFTARALVAGHPRPGLIKSRHCCSRLFQDTRYEPGSTLPAGTPGAVYRDPAALPHLAAARCGTAAPAGLFCRPSPSSFCSSSSMVRQTPACVTRPFTG